MFTDAEIINLHNDKKYRKSNSFCKNVRLSHSVVESGVGGLSLSISATGAPSLSVSLTSFLWIGLRYIFITGELTSCRAKIIENLLNTDFIIAPEKLVERSIGIGNLWLEYNNHKVDVMKRACLEYIETAEHRAILATHSYINEKDILSQAFIDVRARIEQVFFLAKEDLLWKEEKELYKKKYFDALDNEKMSSFILESFTRNSTSGHLTNQSGKEDV
jgi:hypothetical protein